MAVSTSNKIKSMLLPALVLFCVCLTTTALLAVTNEATAPVIAENLHREAQRLYRIVLPEADQFQPQEQVLDGQTYVIQKALKGDQVIGYVFNTQMNGYGGPVVCLTGINLEGSIQGVQILNMEETAGLGANAAKPEFLGQYQNKKGELTVVKTAPKQETEIEAISGATITSNAVTGSVNQAQALFNAITAQASQGGQ